MKAITRRSVISGMGSEDIVRLCRRRAGASQEERSEQDFGRLTKRARLQTKGVLGMVFWIRRLENRQPEEGVDKGPEII